MFDKFKLINDYYKGMGIVGSFQGRVQCELISQYNCEDLKYEPPTFLHTPAFSRPRACSKIYSLYSYHFVFDRFSNATYTSLLLSQDQKM